MVHMYSHVSGQCVCNFIKNELCAVSTVELDDHSMYEAHSTVSLTRILEGDARNIVVGQSVIVPRFVP